MKKKRRNYAIAPQRRVMLCEGCPKRIICAFAGMHSSAVRLQRYRAGEFIVRQGEPRTNLVLCQGLVMIVRLFENGEELVLQTCGVAGLIDLSGWLEGSEGSSISARSLVDSVVATVSVEALSHIISQGSQRARILLRQVGSQIQESEERLRWQASQNATSRVVHSLLKLIAQLGLTIQGKIVVPIPLSRAVFAQLVGLQRETLSRILSRLQGQGVILLGKGHITIPNLRLLQKVF